MFSRSTPSLSSTSISLGPEATKELLEPSRVLALCQEFLEAHENVIALRPPADEPTSPQNQCLLTAAEQHRARALQCLSNCRSTCVSDVRAKLNILSVLEHWFSDEDPRTARFALLTLREVEPFLLSDRDEEPDQAVCESAGPTPRSGWLFSKLMRI
jgi:hypothetical protein